MAVDVDALGARFQLIDHKKALDIVTAIAEPPVLTRTIEGASTVEVTCADASRKLLRDPAVATRSVVVVDAIRFELVALTKTGNRYKLTFEDEVVAKLRRETKRLSVHAGRVTRADFARRLAREAKVDLAVDPSLDKRRVRTAFERSHGQKTNSWDILGSDVAEPVHVRRFSDGTRLVLGGDEWLAGRFKRIRIAEHTGAVNDINFDLDTGKRASRATLDVDVKAWTIPPGAPVGLDDMGPADGNWLVSEVSQPLTSSRGTVTLTRPRHQLPEPKKKDG
jgi:hypothetical protein